MGKSSKAVLAILAMASVIFFAGCQQKASEEFEENDMYDGPGQAIEFEIERTKDPATGRVPWNKLWQAIEQTEQAKGALRNSPNTVELLNWIERGPNGDFTVGGNPRPNNDQTAGRIRAAMIDSLDPTHKTVWVGGVDGGLWKTTDVTIAPSNWVLINDFLSNLAVSAICQDPRPGFQNIMYFCTGESFSNADAVRGVGVFKSTDAGATWNFLPSSSSYLSCTRIVCDAQGNVYLATRNTGLLRSTDGGSTWTTITPSGIGNSVCDLELSTTGRLHVTTGIFSQSGYSYTDNPATVTSGSGWNAAATPFTTFNQRTEIAVSGNVLYALPCNGSYQVPTIWKSTDGGVNWTSTVGQPTGGWASGQGWYSLSVGINPANTDECIVGGLDTHKTADGGGSWVRISTWASSTGQYVHADQHNVQWWDGGSKLLFACDGGIHYSSNGGTTIRDRNKGLRLKQFYSVAVHPIQTNYFIGGTQDNGMHRMDHPGLDSSQEVVGGDGCYSAIDQDQGQYQFGSYVYNVYRRSINNGLSWTTPVNNQSTGRFVNPWDYDNSANIVYACNTTGNYLRWNNPQTGGTTEVVTATGFTGNVSAVHASPYTPNKVYFGMGSGGIQYVNNANTGTSVTATDITPTGASGYANCVVTGASDQNLMACYSSYGVTNVWVSTNGGTSWTACDGNLPDMPVRWGLFYPENNAKAYIATETGVWETDLLNGASTIWNPSTSFPTVRVDMIKYRPSDRTIAAGTHGRGIWTASVPPPTGFSLTAPPAVTSPCPAGASMSAVMNVISNGGFTNPVTLNATGNPAGTTVSFSANPVTPTPSPGTPVTVTLNGTNTLSNGSYVITVSGTASGAPNQSVNLTFTILAGAGPTITAHPVSQTVCEPAPVTFVVAATGATSYQWQLSIDGGSNYSNIGGATSTSYTIAATNSTMNNNRYRAVTTGQCGNSTSNPAILTVNSAPSITVQPQSATVCTGVSSNLCVTSTGNNLTYQWQASTSGCGGPWTNIPAATSNCYTATPASTTSYQVIITSGTCGSTTSACATVTVVSQPAITGQPSDATICDGGNTSFAVAASGTGLNYQWQVSTDGGTNWSNIINGGVYTGATSNILNITGGNTTMNGYRYKVIVSNPSCTSPATSNSAALTVNSLAAISAQPQSVTICSGSSNTFSVTASGTGISYQWQLSTDGGTNYSNIPGATSSGYTVSSTTSAMTGYRYKVVVSGTCPPPATSNPAILTVIDPVAISPTGQPKDSAVCETGNAAFTISATSTQTINYQWQVSTDGGTNWTNLSNGGVYSGVNTANLSLTSVTAVMNNYRYRVLLTNATCTTPVPSNASKLTVNPRPTVTLTASPYIRLFPGLTTTLTATILPSASGFNITWTRNGATITGITGTTYTADVTRLGAYQVAIINAITGCNNLSNILNITDSVSSKLFIYPSPNDGRFTVSYYNGGGASTQRTIVVFDSKGRKVHDEKFNITGPYTLLSIDVRPAQTGVYYVSVLDLSGKRIAEGKVMVH